jgi:hypothetical protein
MRYREVRRDGFSVFTVEAAPCVKVVDFSG